MGTNIINDGKRRETILFHELTYATKDRWKTVNGQRVSYEVEDKTQIISDDFYRIPRTSCRSCKGDNSKPYTTIYYKELYGSFNTVTKFKYCFTLGYCEECAKRQAVKMRDPFDQLEMHSRSKYQLVGDKYPTYITELSDGSIIESCDEVQAKCYDR